MRAHQSDSGFGYTSSDNLLDGDLSTLMGGSMDRRAPAKRGEEGIVAGCCGQQPDSPHASHKSPEVEKSPWLVITCMVICNF